MNESNEALPRTAGTVAENLTQPRQFPHTKKSNTTLDQIVANACRLYSLPAVAMKVIELTENPQVDTLALKQCLETDPALTGKVLRVVNSSLYGLSREVSDLNQALALLGTKPLKLLVLGFSLPPGLFEGLAAQALQNYWRHTLIKAVAAREIAESFWRQGGDEPFIAGLLQDLGALLLIQELDEPYVQFLTQAVHYQAELADLEHEALGFEHTQLTSRLLHHWRLPASLADAVSLSETPQTEDDGSLGTTRRILRLAELVARLLADGQSDALAQLLDEGKVACGMTRPAVEEFITGLEGKVQQLAEALSVDLAGQTDYHQLLEAAHARLAEVATEVAGDLVAATSGQSSHEEPLEDLLTQLSQAAASVGTRSQPSSAAASSPDASATGAPVAAERSTQSPSAVVSATVVPVRLTTYVGTAAAACRQARSPLSLLLVELNQPESIALALGRHGFLQTRGQIEQVCRGLDHKLRACLAWGEAGFLLILSDCERRTAVEHGQSLINTVRDHWTSAGSAVSVSVGVASISLPPVNFDPQLMLESADRCLRGAHASGGSVVKSIEIY